LKQKLNPKTVLIIQDFHWDFHSPETLVSDCSFGSGKYFLLKSGLRPNLGSTKSSAKG